MNSEFNGRQRRNEVRQAKETDTESERRKEEKWGTQHSMDESQQIL